MKDFKKHIGYFSLLGSGTIYASPIFAATPGSNHGYDVINPLIFNPEITSISEFTSLGSGLKKHNLGWLQDIVPNHMAYNNHNEWMMDLLEKGALSEYIDFFDLEPDVPGDVQKMMVPFLGVTLDEALKNNEIKIGFLKGNFTLKYYDNEFPVQFKSFRRILENKIERAPAPILKLWMHYKIDTRKAYAAFLNHEWEKFKNELLRLYKREKNNKAFIDDILVDANKNHELRNQILEEQHYYLCHWQEAERKITYRRFFTVNGLICLRMEKEQVFTRYHQLISRMVDEEHFQGLRIDHIDGLNNPGEYLERLRKLCGKETYIVAEKILEPGEDFPGFWPIQGNTGYDFLASVNNLLTSTKNYDRLHNLYKDITHQTLSPEELIYQNKRMMLNTNMHGEWDNILRYFNHLNLINYKKANIGEEEIKEAIGEFMLACPVYRLYPQRFPPDRKNKKVIKQIIENAQIRNPAIKPALDHLAKIFLSTDNKDPEHNQKVCSFFTRMMQYTGPLMAKGVEDTSMYQYNLFITHNEVGDAINARGISIKEYHEQMIQRQAKWPLTINTTSTHDTKRGEDVRARLNVISEFTPEWEEIVSQWMQMNQKLKTRLDSGLLEPSLSVEYFIYQTLLGTFPEYGTADDVYKNRIDEYLVKALRESKRKVSWSNPDETYESTVCQFAQKLLDPKHDFLNAFIPFQQKIARFGVVNSLTQLTLKCTSPGLPDIYQGTETWDLTLVDPDNRQSVDYDMMNKALRKLIKQNTTNHLQNIRKLIKNHTNGHIKLWLTYLLLNLRKENPDLFLYGEYMPLRVKGKYEKNVLAYARNYQDKWVIVLVPLFLGSILKNKDDKSFEEFDWADTNMVLPKNAAVNWKNIITEQSLKYNKNWPIKELFITGLPSIIISVE
jgi:malto-oligosyltrehalose synthase